jgi:glycerophosphoryl diester phosphodiesterase
MKDRIEGPAGPSSASSAADAGVQPGARRPITIAHRAGNDRATLERALSAGVDAVEADLRWDGGCIVNRHDRRLPFLPLYWDRWYLRLDRGPQLTLDEVLDRTRGRVRPYLDLKSQSRPFLRVLLETLRRHDAVDDVEISSGYWSQLAELRRSEPALRLFRTVGDEQQRTAYLALPPNDPLEAGVVIHRDLLDEEMARLLRAREVTVYVWAVEDLGEAKTVLDRGASGIIADSLELLRALK